MVKITEKYLEKIKPGTKDQYHRDDTLKGFAVKVTPTGRISFIAEGRVRKGRSRRITLGRHPALAMKEARELAMNNLNEMQKGVDPVLKEREERGKQEALSKTLNDIFHEYLSLKALKPNTKYDYMNTFLLTFSELGKRPIRSISRQEILELYFKTKSKRGDSTAAKFKRIGSAIFKFAMADEVDGERLIKENPFNIITEKGIRIPVKKRDSFLTDKDISKLITFYMNFDNWSSTPKHGVTRQGINYVILLMTTGLRKSEALRLKWNHVDWINKTFTAFETKNSSNHIVPMSTTTEWILNEQQKISLDSPYVFPSQKTGMHMTEPKSQLSKIRRATKLNFTFHDLRRTFATHAEALGQSHELIRKALNHKSGGGITSQYIITQVETLRPVFQAVAEGYREYYDPDWKGDVMNEGD